MAVQRIIFFSNEFPPDGLSATLRKLHIQSKQHRHSILGRFFVEANTCMKDEIRKLPTELRHTIPTFESILHFADCSDLRTGRLGASIDGVLLCMVQLGTLIGHFENEPDKFVQHGCDKPMLAGLGIGLLVSSAVSISSSLDDLVIAGGQIVRLSFRLGVVVSQVSANLEPSPEHEAPPSWAYVIPGVDPTEAQNELDAAQAAKNTPEAAKIFISAISGTSVTVSGPPSRLQGLFRSWSFFRDKKFIALPVFGGLCHACHIYQDTDVERVLHIPKLPERFLPTGQVWSTSSGKPFPASSIDDLHHQIIAEIMTKAILWDLVADDLTRSATSMSSPHVEVMTFRSSLPVKTLINSLELESAEAAVRSVDLMAWLGENEPSKPRTSMESKIAIIGMSCRMPGGAVDTEGFWNVLEQGLDVSRKIPGDRFDVDSHCDLSGKDLNKSHTPYGCFIDEPGLMDAPFFNMSPREAEQTDPMQRLAIVTAYEALERAGFVAGRTPSSMRERVGVWYGQASDDYREVNTAQEISTYFIPGGCRAFGSGRINYFFKFSGPSFNCDTACSSSLAAIQAACTALWAGDVDTVITGGLNVLTNSDAFCGLSNGHFLSKIPGACKTWDETADGYCRSDGVGTIIMKRLEDAIADNDNVLGVIPAAATNHSADAISITHPHAGAQATLYRQVLDRAGIDPLEVSFVEMHGTGTQAGDSVEMESITEVFAPLNRRRGSQQPLHIGAVKGNMGHGEAAAGVTALLKVLCMMQKDAIPPHVGIKTRFNPKLPRDLEDRNVKIPFAKVHWPKNGKKRIAMVNSFSAAGGNTSVALEDGPDRPHPSVDDRPGHTVVLSAKSKSSLAGNMERLTAFLQTHAVELADVAYTTTARKLHHNYRVALHATSTVGLIKQLESLASGIGSIKPISATGPPSIAFCFTGQGAAARSSNIELMQCPFFEDQINAMDRIAQQQGFPSILPAIDGSHDKDHAHSPIVTQLSLTCTQIALARYWDSLGIRPEVVVGHSLGEYAALCVAGVLTASDAIYLVGSRAIMLERMCISGTHSMMAVKASPVQIEDCVGAALPFEIACFNGPNDTVLSGPLDEIKAVADHLRGVGGFKCVILDVDFAFHSAQTDPILDEFEVVASQAVLFQEPRVPIISPLLEKVVFDNKTIGGKYLRRATREACNFVAGLERAESMSIVDNETVWIEVGPHPVCINFVKSILPKTGTLLPSFRRGENNWTTMAQSLGALHTLGFDVRWTEFHRPFESSNKLRLLDLPTYSWNNKTYWLQYHGTWALTKGNTFYEANRSKHDLESAAVSAFSTSLVQKITEESVEGSAGRVVMQSDLMQPEFLEAARGHTMNGCGVVTSSIHADIANTLGTYLWRKLMPSGGEPAIDVANMEVTRGLVAKNDTSSPQLIQVTASTNDIHSGVIELVWHNVDSSGVVSQEPFATATIILGSKADWLSTWAPLKHLVQSRISDLERHAQEGTATTFTRNMAYTLFAHNLVDYANKYRGMQAVILEDLEAFADVTLYSKHQLGTWTIPPYFIDSVCHLAGFVMNVSDASDTANTFCVTPGWQSMRFAKPLVAGARYRSYVKMIPTPEDPTIYLGDVYILQDGDVIGMVRGIQFRRYPRVLLARFFSPPDSSAAKSFAAAGNSKKETAGALKDSDSVAESPTTTTTKSGEPKKHAHPLVPKVAVVKAPPTPPDSEDTVSTADNSHSGSIRDDRSTYKLSSESDTVTKAMALVVQETGLSLEELNDDAGFGDIGVDSLMSLVISEKFRQDLGINVGSSLFLEYPTIGALKAWLEEYHG